jgi:hypothetical protein
MTTHLVQSGVCGYEQLIQLVKHRHSVYCSLHGIQYHPFTERTNPTREGNWDAVDRLVQVLEEAAEGDIVVSLDADSLIMDRAIHLDRALPGPLDIIGMVPSSHIAYLRSQNKGDVGDWATLPQYISGGCWTRKTPRTMHLWRKVQQVGPLPNPMGWRVQATLMRLLSEFCIDPTPLSPRWFMMPYHTTANPIIIHPLPGLDVTAKINLFRSLVGAIR